MVGRLVFTRVLLLLLWGSFTLNLAACTVDVAATATPTAVPTLFIQPAATTATIPSPTQTPTDILVATTPAVITPTATETAVPTHTPAATSTPLPSPVFTPAGQFQIAGQTGGSVTSVAVAGGLAYVGIGPRLVVVDASNPAEPRQIGQSNVLPGLVTRVAVDGRFAYVATDEPALWLIDIATPEHPQLIHSVTVPGPATRLKIENETLFVLGTPDVDNRIPPWLHSYQTTQSAELTLVGTTQPAELTYDMDIAGQYLYLVGEYGLSIIDVSNAADLTQTRSTLAIVGSNFTVDIDGSYAYLYGNVEEKGKGIKIIDVSNPSQPAEIARSGPICFFCHNLMVIQNGYAFLAWGSTLEIVSVADHDNMSLASHLIAIGAGSGDLFLSEGFIFVAGGNALAIINVNNPLEPTITGRFESPGYFRQIGITLNHLYTIDGAMDDLVIFDLTNPTSPAVVSTYPITRGYPDVLEIAGERAYVTTSDGDSLAVVNVSTPAAPVGIGLFNAERYIDADDIAIYNGFVYLELEDHIAILDTGNPTDIQIVGSLNLDSDEIVSAELTIAASYLYMTARSGLYVFDLSNPAAPSQIAFIEGHFSGRPASAGNHLYISQSYRDAEGNFTGREITIFDITNPSNPAVIGRLPGLSLRNLTLSGDYLYGTESFQTVWAINVANPSAPHIVAYTHTPGFLLDLATYGDLLYAADREGGLLVLQLQETD
jgi:hypothetical protein